MITIIDKTDRRKLGEGRNYQMGFAFAKNTGEDEYELVQPISPCKDYLNDVVLAQILNRKIEAYGLVAIPQDLFKDKVYIVFAICDYPSGGYSNLNEDIEVLSNIYSDIETMLIEVEKNLGFEEFTQIKQINKNLYLTFVPKRWIESSYLISLYSLLIRAFQYNVGKVPAMDFLRKFPANIETMLVINAIKALDDMIINGIKKPDFNNVLYQGDGLCHNQGILKYINGFK